MNLHDIQYERVDSRLFHRAFLVTLQNPQGDPDRVQELIAELCELVQTLDIEVAGSAVVKIDRPRPRYLIGSGKAREILAQARETEADVIVFDDELSPSQQRNWTQLANMPVIDRQEVILDIFGRRAQTREAELQIALARAEYDLPRLKRRWTHLSRQRGGTGGGVGLRGGGEQQIEVDYRLVQQRISRLRKELEEVRRKRNVQRKQRMRKPVATAALVGYTNAGKSSILNALTDSSLLTEDKLFATLDPTSRRLELQGQQELVISDTVGFIRKLPHSLIDAFKATLEEAAMADYIVEVLDITSGQVPAHHETTCRVLEELGADKTPRIIVLNKVDLVQDTYTIPRMRRRFGDPVFTSAASGSGLPELKKRLGNELCAELVDVEGTIPHNRYDLVALIHRSGMVEVEDAVAEGTFVRAAVSPQTAGKLEKFMALHGLHLTG